jgi:hypothetical protein
MRIKRTIISAILALTAAGSIAAGATMAVASTSAPVAAPHTYYHG